MTDISNHSFKIVSLKLKQGKRSRECMVTALNTCNFVAFLLPYPFSGLMCTTGDWKGKCWPQPHPGETGRMSVHTQQRTAQPWSHEATGPASSSIKLELYPSGHVPQHMWTYICEHTISSAPLSAFYLLLGNSLPLWWSPDPQILHKPILLCPWGTWELLFMWLPRSFLSDVSLTWSSYCHPSEDPRLTDWYQALAIHRSTNHHSCPYGMHSVDWRC